MGIEHGSRAFTQTRSFWTGVHSKVHRRLSLGYFVSYLIFTTEKCDRESTSIATISLFFDTKANEAFASRCMRSVRACDMNQPFGDRTAGPKRRRERTESPASDAC